MKEKLFREKSIERVSSPEQLNDYIKVCNPGMWMILAAILIFLAGVCVWCVTARLESKINVVCISDGESAQLVVKEADRDLVNAGMTVTIDGVDYTITSIANRAMKVDDSINEYAQYKGNVKVGEWIFFMDLDDAPESGTYSANIVVESVAPISFILN